MSRGRRVDSRVLLVAVVFLALSALGPVATASHGSDRATEPADQRVGQVLTVSPNPGGTAELWPYTSRRKSFDSATLPINMVVLAPPSVVRTVLLVGPDATWENQTRGLNGSGAPVDEGDGEFARVSVNDTGIRWDEARGAARYTYVRSGDGSEGQWIHETYQLHDGDYFGSRYHIRFYEVPDGDTTWTALQVHREHWDWFRLRHTVGSLPQAQHYVETEFYDRWYVVDVQRRRFTGGGILNSDGWATVVDFRPPAIDESSPQPTSALVGVAAVGGLGAWLSRLRRRHLGTLATSQPFDARVAILAISLAALPLVVRTGSLAVEGAEVVNDPKVVAAAFYPILALGVPVVAYGLAAGLDPAEGFLGAAAGFGAGVLVDYAALGIAILPIEVVVHRVLLVIAVGLVAAGSAGRASKWPARRRSLLVGASLWVAGLCWALFLM